MSIPNIVLSAETFSSTRIIFNKMTFSAFDFIDFIKTPINANNGAKINYSTLLSYSYCFCIFSDGRLVNCNTFSDTKSKQSI